jgi:hypothetical protein
MEKKETDNRVIIRCAYGLGNQMFFYALYKYLKCQGINMYLDITWYTMAGGIEFVYDMKFPFNKYKLDNYFNLKEIDIVNDVKDILCFTNVYRIKTLMTKGHLTIKELLQVIMQKSLVRILRRFRIQLKTRDILFDELSVKNEKFPEISDKNNYYLTGLFQTYRYCNPIREILLTDFSFSKPLSRSCTKTLDDIEKSNSVSIHVRRVGYANDDSNEFYKNNYGAVCTMEYYKNAINYLKKDYSDLKFFLFSDDTDWVREHFSFLDNYCIVDNSKEEYPDYCDLFLMTKVKHNIISNGTFAWWGAWLNQNPSKIVIVPECWRMKPHFILDIDKICPPEWIRIPRS